VRSGTKNNTCNKTHLPLHYRFTNHHHCIIPIHTVTVPKNAYTNVLKLISIQTELLRVLANHVVIFRYTKLHLWTVADTSKTPCILFNLNFVFYIPEDGHMVDRRNTQFTVNVNYLQYTPVHLVVPSLYPSTFLYVSTERTSPRPQWPHNLSRRSAAARLLRLWARIPPGAWVFVVTVVYFQVEVSATS
jgi:hypothetical protein